MCQSFNPFGDDLALERMGQTDDPLQNRPVVGIVETHRSLVLEGKLPAADVLVISSLSTIVLFAAGVFVFLRRQPDFEDYL